MRNRDVTPNSPYFFDLEGWAMKCSKRSFASLSVLFAALLSLLLLVMSTGILNARDADLASLTFAAAQTAKRQCVNTCRARYRDCLSLKQIPSSECRGIYQDCSRYTCNADPAGRPFWPGFPS
jgi:hypothetical protein